MKVAVTGASGLLGRTTARRLVEHGHQVVTLQRSAADVPGAEERRVDLRDADAVRRGLGDVDGVIHLAAKVGVLGDAAEFAAVNVDGTRHVLDAVNHGPATVLVHVSTPSVAHHGAALIGAPAGPADPDRVRGAYAATKARAERLVLTHATDAAVIAIRPHLVWGPGDTQLVGRIVERARAGRLGLVGGGRALVDTTYIDDAAEALIAALHAAPTLPAPEAFVVSNGQPRTVSELTERICRAAGVDFAPRSLPGRIAPLVGSGVEAAFNRFRPDDEPPLTRFVAEQLGTAHWFDQRRTQEALAWTPQVGLDEGFERLEAWFAATA